MHIYTVTQYLLYPLQHKTLLLKLYLQLFNLACNFSLLFFQYSFQLTAQSDLDKLEKFAHINLMSFMT